MPISHKPMDGILSWEFIPNKKWSPEKGAIITGLGVQMSTGDLGYDRLNGTRKIGPSCAKSVVYI